MNLLLQESLSFKKANKSVKPCKQLSALVKHLQNIGISLYYSLDSTRHSSQIRIQRDRNHTRYLLHSAHRGSQARVLESGAHLCSAPGDLEFHICTLSMTLLCDVMLPFLDMESSHIFLQSSPQKGQSFQFFVMCL